tara:strand:- start:466 stop:669 length:204 start_codon:yes stop_codon:yes gene_type:complete
LLRALAALCLDARVLARDHALMALQRALLDVELRAALPAHAWATCFERAVFPFLTAQVSVFFGGGFG